MASLFGHPFRLLAYSGASITLAHYCFTHMYSWGYGHGPSMLPTFLVDGETIIFDMAYRRGRGVRVGDCVSYQIPVEPPGEEGVKRVIGMPGDYVLLNSPGATSDRMLQVSFPSSPPPLHPRTPTRGFGYKPATRSVLSWCPGTQRSLLPRRR